LQATPAYITTSSQTNTKPATNYYQRWVLCGLNTSAVDMLVSISPPVRIDKLEG